MVESSGKTTFTKVHCWLGQDRCDCLKMIHTVCVLMLCGFSVCNFRTKVANMENTKFANMENLRSINPTKIKAHTVMLCGTLKKRLISITLEILEWLSTDTIIPNQSAAL